MYSETDKALLRMIREMFPHDDSRRVYIVNGAPASGKTAYVREHRKKGDLVFDLDHICAALGGTDKLYEDHKPYLDTALAVRDVVFDKIENREGKWRNAYVITASSERDYVESLAYRLGGEIVSMNATKEQCLEHARHDERRRANLDEHLALIEKWFE